MELQTRSDRTFAVINITPFVDVTLVLLVIFMIVTPMVGSDGIRAPRVAHPGASPDRAVTIAVYEGGVVSVAGVIVRRDEVPGAIARLRKSRPEVDAIVRGDRRLPYGTVLEILSWAREGGFPEVTLAVDRE